ncbi:hypothetical protein [Streptomyces sp. NPDC058308]|uniref:hypothetical protein n=1 Tax=Streptomyces sp. NPDC058308 TaxID=3346440 RepID=UPI0036E7E7DD
MSELAIDTGDGGRIIDLRREPDAADPSCGTPAPRGGADGREGGRASFTLRARERAPLAQHPFVGQAPRERGHVGRHLGEGLLAGILDEEARFLNYQVPHIAHAVAVLGCQLRNEVLRDAAPLSGLPGAAELRHPGQMSSMPGKRLGFSSVYG